MVLHYDLGRYGHPREWVLLDRKKRKVLKAFGSSKPSHEQVMAEERRVQKYKYMARVPVRANNPGSLKRRGKHKRKVFILER